MKYLYYLSFLYIIVFILFGMFINYKNQQNCNNWLFYINMYSAKLLKQESYRSDWIVYKARQTWLFRFLLWVGQVKNPQRGCHLMVGRPFWMSQMRLDLRFQFSFYKGSLLPWLPTSKPILHFFPNVDDFCEIFT